MWYHSFLLPNDIPLYKYTVFYLSIHQFIAICLLWMFLAIMNNAAMNICVYVFAWTYIFNSLGYMPRRGNFCIIWPLYVWPFKKLPDFSRVAVPLYILIISVWGFQILHILINTCSCLSFLSQLFYGFESISYFGFNSHFPNG